MNITLKYTQPIFFDGQVQNTKNHIIQCHDVDTHPNGQPKADGAFSKWDSILEKLSGAGVGATIDIGEAGSYERIA
jgi:hypothetical protein